MKGMDKFVFSENLILRKQLPSILKLDGRGWALEHTGEAEYGGIYSFLLLCLTGKMSMLSAAALLDELMGVDRDRAPNEKKTALHWSDPQVIVSYFYSSLFKDIFVVWFVDKN